MRGGRFRRKFGALTLGATYVNQYGVQGNREGGDKWYGTAHNLTPTPIFLAIRFLDDSPLDGEGGPIVFDVRLKVDGKFRDDIRPQIILDDVTRDKTTAISDPAMAKYLHPKPNAYGATGMVPKFDFLSIFETFPKFSDYVFLTDYYRGNNTANITKRMDIEKLNSYYTLLEPDGKPVRVNGNQSVVYLFDISGIQGHVNRCEAVVTVANDYRIQTSTIYTENTRGGKSTDGGNTTWYKTDYWRTMAQAEGNIKDGSNMRTIRIDFGAQVASLIYGFDADFNYHGFKIKGEFVTNSTHYMYSDGETGTGMPSVIVSGQPRRTGHKWAQLDHAYYVTAEKDWNMLGFAGEVFKMGKFYRPYYDYYCPQVYGVGAYGVYDIIERKMVVRLPLVEDNDDNDMYPDTMAVRKALGVGSPLVAVDHDGVFPGNDEDNDGFPDNNKNFNDIPDYYEDFLMFDVDPDEYIFGNDYNNNSIPDFREDDMKLDTPYDLDRQGHHFFFRISPEERVNFFVGSLRSRGVGLDSRTHDDYIKLQMNYDVLDVGSLYAELRHERVKDNFRDQYVVHSTIGQFAHREIFSRQLAFDDLEYRNSKVNRLWLASKIRAIPSITMENHVKLERNNQGGGTMYDGTYQPGDTIGLIAMTNKIIYTKRWGNFFFMPGVKFRFYKKNRAESINPLDHYMERIPIITFKYVFSLKTDVTFGMQGIPRFEYRFKDYIQSRNNFKAKTYLLQLQNKSIYFGYTVWGAMGLTYDQFSYDKIYRQIEETKSSSIFTKIYLGW